MSAAPRTLLISEMITLQPAEALANLLDTEVPVGTLPPLWHWIHLRERPKHRDLGPDGQPLTGFPAPPGPGMRRMFAGGRVTAHAELRFGEVATRESRVVEAIEKEGRTGPLTFVTVRHEISQAGEVLITEENDIVYRAADSGPLPTGDASESPEREARLYVAADEAFLFRFSALTYNAHRIHYDHKWARVEGYDDLVVHGPLQALMMGELHRRVGSGLVGRHFSYRLVAPMVGPQTFSVLAGRNGLATGAEVRDSRGVTTAVSRLTRE